MSGRPVAPAPAARRRISAATVAARDALGSVTSQLRYAPPCTLPEWRRLVDDLERGLRWTEHALAEARTTLAALSTTTEENPNP